VPSDAAAEAVGGGVVDGWAVAEGGWVLGLIAPTPPSESGDAQTSYVRAIAECSRVIARENGTNGLQTCLVAIRSHSSAGASPPSARKGLVLGGIPWRSVLPYLGS
jgi:hypothetical protein